MHTGLAGTKQETKRKSRALPERPEQNTDLGHEASKDGMGLILFSGAAIGLIGFFFLVVGLINNAGIAGCVKGWLAAFAGL